MELHDGLWDWTKHIWEIIVASVSAVVSYVLYKFKKNGEELAADRDMLHDHDTTLQVMHEKLKNFDSDIAEIKEYLQKILFKIT